MTYPHNILITTPIANTSVIAEFGVPDGSVAEKPIYEGAGWFQMADQRVVERQTGDGFVREDGRVYLPPGEYEITKHDKVIVDGCYVGEVRSINAFTDRFYTRLGIKRDVADGG